MPTIEIGPDAWAEIARTKSAGDARLIAQALSVYTGRAHRAVIHDAKGFTEFFYGEPKTNHGPPLGQPIFGSWIQKEGNTP